MALEFCLTGLLSFFFFFLSWLSSGLLSAQAPQAYLASVLLRYANGHVDEDKYFTSILKLILMLSRFGRVFFLCAVVHSSAWLWSFWSLC